MIRNIDLQATAEWRELGFYFHFCSTELPIVWIFRGDRGGLLCLAHLLRDFAKEPKNAMPGKFIYLGPYCSLRIKTSSLPRIFKSEWTGSPSDFIHLARLIEEHLCTGNKRNFVIGKEFSPNSEIEIRFSVEDDGFDPSAGDQLIEHRQ